MSKEFNKGDAVFSLHGQEGEYVAKTHNGHIVHPLYDSDEDGPYRGDIETWTECFTSPPTMRLHEEIAELVKERDEIQAAVTALIRQNNEAKREHALMIERIKNHAGLESLDMFISGKVTHIVTTDNDGKYHIAPADRCTGYDEFLTLKSRSYGRGVGTAPEWIFSMPRSNRNGVPCSSEEHAKQVIKDLILASMKEWLNSRDPRSWEISRALKDAETFGVEVPAEVWAKIIETEMAAAQSALAKSKGESATAQATIDNLNAKRAALAKVNK